MKRRTWLLFAIAHLIFSSSAGAALFFGASESVFDDGFESPVPPDVTLSATPTVVHPGQNTHLVWSSSAASSCIASAVPEVTGWSGVVALQGALDVVVSNSTHGNYQFLMTCTNQHGATTRSVVVGVVHPPPEHHCSEYIQSEYGGVVPNDPAFVAFGFQRVEVPLQQVFGVPVGQPSGIQPLPAAYLNPSQWRYLAIPFTMPPSGGMGLQWTPVLGPYAPGLVRVTVSPCPGDFRARDFGTTDSYLHGACRTASATDAGQLRIGTTGSTGQCSAPVGKQLYINITTHTTASPDGGAYTCTPGASTCAVSMRVNP